MILFAQTQPALWPTMEHLALVATAVGNVALCIALFRKNRIEPQPLEVREAHDFAKERDCLARHNAVEAQIREIRKERGSDIKEASESRRALYSEVTGIRREVGEMERRLNTADESRTAEVHTRINEILEAVGELRGQLRIKN